ncbi:MAG: SprT-like domain-containing protein [Acidobacteriota bacterium]
MELDALYDEINRQAFKSELPKIPIYWSKRMVRAAGIFYEPIIGQRTACIKLSVPLLLERVREFPVQVAGLICMDRETIVRRVLEHEMVHVYLWLKHRPNDHSEEFCQLAFEKFGHTEMRHTLRYGPAPITEQEFSVGARVRFPFREELMRGIILRIRRNATVLAEDKRKYYVPLSLLHYELETAD